METQITQSNYVNTRRQEADNTMVQQPEEHHSDLPHLAIDSEINSADVISAERKFEIETGSPSELQFTQEKQALLQM